MRHVGSIPAQEDHWIPLSDLMTGLMFFFLVIALAYMVQVEVQQRKVREIALLYNQTRLDLYHDLYAEFHSDLPRWHAVLNRDDLSIRFTEPRVLFSTGSSEITPEFHAILADFFPRYVRILTNRRYGKAITEVRIEGYTSTIWAPGVSKEDSYFKNMELSQARTRAVLQYVMGLPALNTHESWLMDKVTANGLSFSHLVMTDGLEDQQRSQRVEFKIRTNADRQIHSILEVAR